jgi:hypothetical protein
MDIEQLERALAGDGAYAGRPDLATIHRDGTRRRRATAIAAGGAATLAIAAIVGIGVVVAHAGDRGSDVAVATDPPAAPRSLSPLAERALAEIPGAVQVSDWQVVLPAPGKTQFQGPRETPHRPVALPSHTYSGVTSFPRSAFPGWLWDGTEQAEMAAGDEDRGYPVGSSDITGILVDQGRSFLGCTPAPYHGESFDGAECWPGVFHRDDDGTWVRDYGIGTERFLTPGAQMEVFLDKDYSTGAERTVALAGIDGTDVERVEFVATDGTVVEGTVEAGTVVPGDSLFFADVPGELAKVVAYDARGEIVEDHPLKECATPVECEVR